ncbi:MAG: substrate-binding domain-containing protein [Lachnospiraceae bacterium]|nr:substrate-binding domain-containing protein [Lachnospiraceae bacterium]MBR1650863.1 substrate-binding domain-containing protein [Lachnospiraceae bacterium]
MKKLLAGILAVSSALLLLSGCGSKAGAAAGGSTKIYLSYTGDDFKTAFANAAIAEAQAKGVTLEANANDATVEMQVESIKKAVAGGATAIICIAANAQTAQELEVAAGGVPIIFCNSAPDADYLKADKYIYVGSSEEQAGQFQAEHLIAMNPGKKSFDIVMFKGEKNHSGAVGRQNGFKNTMKDNGITVNYVFEDHANWKGETAVEEFEMFLKTNQNYDAVVCHNDTMAVAVAEYMDSHGIDTSKIPVLGVDATADGVAALEKGILEFTVYQSAVGQGTAAVDAAIELSKGKSVSSIDGVDKTNTYIYVPFEAVDKSNYKNYK